jgi:4,5-dihydroxyphthalate decarboxylase
MIRPKLSMALALYDRHIAFFDGSVAVRDVDLQVLAVGEANSLRDGGRRHHRMLIDLEFDACEVSLSSYVMAKSQGLPVIAIPVFPRRLFIQSNIWTHDESTLREPMDLVGRKVGLITFQTTLSVQARGDLQTEYAVPWREIDWYVAADEPIAFADPGTVVLKRIPRGKKLGEMLASKSLDAIITPRPPGPTSNPKSKFRRLFQKPRDEEARYFQKHAFFPAMHVIALREETVQKYPWVAAAFLQAFQQAHDICRSYYTDPNWTIHAWTQHLSEEEQDRLGPELWPLGVKNNRNNIELFLTYLVEQGLITEKMPLANLFAADETADSK